MIREMRCIDQQLSEELTVKLLESATSGTFALAGGDDGYPYAVPVSHVYEDGHIYFHGYREGHKIDAIKRSNMASFCVISRDDVAAEEVTTYFESVIAFGKVYIVEDADEKQHALQLLGDRFCKSFPQNVRDTIESCWDAVTVIRFDIEHMTGKIASELLTK